MCLCAENAGREMSKATDIPSRTISLLLVSGIVLAGAMFAGFWWVDPLVRDPVLAKYVLTLPLLAVAAGITWLANRALRR